MKIMQRGNRVTVRSDGTRDSVPAPLPKSRPTGPDRALPVIGGVNAANRAAREAAGMKDGGLVKSTPKATPYRCGGAVKK